MKWLRFSGWVWVALGLTACYVLFAWHALSPVPVTSPCSEGKVTLLQSCLTLNEVGDLASGLFAPVAFIWLAVAVLVQAQELNAQREELKLTRSELAAQREVWESQLEETRSQTRVLIIEGEERARGQADKELEMLLNAIARPVTINPDALLFRATYAKNPPSGPQVGTLGVTRTRSVEEANNVDDRILALAQSAISTASTSLYKMTKSTFALDPSTIDLLVGVFDDIDNLKPHISHAARIRLETIWVEEIAGVVRHLHALREEQTAQ